MVICPVTLAIALGLLNDLRVWCRATGYEFLSERPGVGEALLRIHRGEPLPE
jgi:hypothetical protein